MNNDYNAGGTVVAKTYPGTPAPSRPVDIAPYNPGQTGVGSTDISNFSVLKLQDIINQLKTLCRSISNENGLVADYAGLIASRVRSGDSNLSDAWANVREAVSKFSGKFNELSEDYDTEINKYIEETVSLEIGAALNVEEVSEEINDICSQLDSLFGM